MSLARRMQHATAGRAVEVTAAITFVGATTANTTTSISTPSGVAANDILLAFVTQAGGAIPAAPAGWTHWGRVADNTTLQMNLYYRTAVSGEAASHTFSAQFESAIMVAYRGQDVAEPFNSWTTDWKDSTTTLDIPSNRMSAANCRVVYATAVRARTTGSNVITGPSGSTQRASIGPTDTFPMRVDDISYATKGRTRDITVTGDNANDPMYGLGIALRPSGAAEDVPGWKRVFWLHAGDLGLVDGSAVAKWEGQYTATANYEPTYRASSINGKPGVGFDSQNDGMSFPVNTINANAVISAVPYALILVWKYVGAAGSAVRRVVQGADNNYLVGPYNGYVAMYAVNGWVSSTALAAAAGTAYKTRSRDNGTDTRFFVNGVDRTQNAANRGTPGRLGLGVSGQFPEPADSELCELIAWSRDLTAAELSAVDTYLNDLYAL